MNRIAIYKELSKSGIVALVLISVLGGYLSGQPFDTRLDWVRLTITLLGVLFLASGSSAMNQLQEAKIDATMPRTRNRPLPSGRISARDAAFFIFLTLALGLVLLAQLSHEIMVLGIAAVISYNLLYTLWWKKRWAFAAIPGAIPGAIPILMGYSAAAGTGFSRGGLYLFAILFFWQMPHFWVLALKYRSDYQQGGIPTLPVAKGAFPTVLQIGIWCLAYIGLGLGAPLFLPVGKPYLVVALITGFKLLWELRAFARAPESRHWLHFFLWINFSLIAYIGAVVGDLWSEYLHWWVR